MEKKRSLKKRIALCLLCVAMVFGIVNLPVLTPVAHAETEQPINITVSYSPSTGIVASWDAVPNATSYTVLLEEKKDDTWPTLVSRGVETNTITFEANRLLFSESDDFRVTVWARGIYDEIIAAGSSDVFHSGLQQILPPTVTLSDEGIVKIVNNPNGPIPDLYYCNVYAIVNGDQKKRVTQSPIYSSTKTLSVLEYIVDGYSYEVRVIARSKNNEYKNSKEVASNVINYKECPRYNIELPASMTVTEGDKVSFDMDIANIDKVSRITWYFDDGISGPKVLKVPGRQSIILTDSVKLSDAGTYYAEIVINGNSFYTKHLKLNVTTYKCGENCKFKIENDKLTIFGKGPTYDWKTGTPIWMTAVDENGLGIFYNVKNIVIEEGITGIGARAFDFDGFSEKDRIIESVTFPDTLKSIGLSAFQSCQNLKEIDLPKNLETIGERAFCHCKGLTEVYIPSKNVGDVAFGDCANLTKATFGPNVESIGSVVFDACKNLEFIIFRGDAPSFSVVAFHSLSDIIVYYPGDNPTWTEAVRQDYYGKNVTWLPYQICEKHTFENKDNKYHECSLCGEIENHDFSKCVSNGDGSHKVVCKVCDAVKEGHDKDACVGGKATCTKKAKCTVCGEEYGKLASHKYATTWTTDGTNHWHECTVCGKKKDSAAHTLKTTTTTKATLTADGKKETKCTVCSKVTKTTKIYAAKTIKLSKTTYAYDGKAKKPTVTVKDSKDKAIATTNYTVTYDDGRKNVGKYNVKITFKGDYKGSKTLTFTINPKAITLKTVTPASKAFTVTWSKQTTQVDGYEIQYALDDKFTSSAKKVEVNKNTTTSKKISSLKSKKTYYVRVRTYKKVGTKKYYSDWSKVMSVKTK